MQKERKIITNLFLKTMILFNLNCDIAIILLTNNCNYFLLISLAYHFSRC